MKNGGENDNNKNLVSPRELDEELLIEWNLLRILGMYFCLDKNKVPLLTGPQEFLDTINDPQEVMRRPIRIVPNPNYGHPSFGALRVFFAILRKFLQSGYPLPPSVQFSQRELHRLIGSNSGGFQGKQLAVYLLQLRSTMIESRRYAKATGEWYFRPFTLVSDMYLSGRKNSLEYCYIELDKDIHESINVFYGLRMFYHRLVPLSPVEKILYINLFNAFSILFRKEKKREGLCYNKDYAALLAEWLPHFKVLTYVSDIKKDQLGRHLDGLIRCGLISSWNIKKNRRETGFTLYFYGGQSFFEDYERIQHGRAPQMRLAIDNGQRKGPYDDQRALLSYYFSKLHHGAIDAVPNVFTENDRKFAASVLNTLSLEEAKDFVDYALDEESPKTDYHPILFKGIEQYLLRYLSVKEKRRAALEQRLKQAEVEHRRAEEAALRERYEDFWRVTVGQLRDRIPPQTLASLEKKTYEELEREGVHHLTLKTMVRVRMNQKISTLYGVPNFSGWKEGVAKGKNYNSIDYLPETSRA